MAFSKKVPTKVSFATPGLETGEGSLFVRKRVKRNGVRWSVVYIDQYGSRHEKTAGGTKKSAEILKAELEKQKAAGTLGKPKPENPKFSEFCERFITIKQVEVKPTTITDYKQLIKNHLAPFFGELRLSDITPIKIQEYLEYMVEKKTTPATTGKSYRALKVILRLALSLELISKDPTIAIKPPRVERGEMDFLNEEEVVRLLDAAEGDMYILLLIACCTGLRQGEILALQWRDIDFDTSLIRVARSYNPRYGMMDLKTASSMRTVPMITMLTNALKSFYEDSGKPCPESLLFKDAEGNPIDRDRLVSTDFEGTLKKAGIRRIRFHGLRHTFASLCISAGMDPKALQHAMGHSTISTTMDIYAHLFPGSYDLAMARLDAKLSVGDGPLRLPKREAV